MPLGQDNFRFSHGIYIDASNSSQTLMVNLDIESVSNSPIYIAHGWPYMIIADSFLKAPVNYPAIYADNMDGYYIGGNILETTAISSAPAISITHAELGVVGLNQVNPDFSAPTSIRCLQGCTDLSRLGSGSIPTPIIVTSSGTSTFGTFGGPANIQLQANNGGAKFLSCAYDDLGCANFYLDYFGSQTAGSGSVVTALISPVEERDRAALTVCGSGTCRETSTRHLSTRTIVPAT